MKTKLKARRRWQQNFSLIAMTLIAASFATMPADAKKKTTRTGQSNTVVSECVKQNGGYYDPATRKWTIYSSRDAYSFGAAENLRKCIARGLGIPPSQVAIPESHEATQ